MTRSLVVLVLVVGLALARPASAQVRGGSIAGHVKDQQGNVLPGATVTAQGADFTRSIETLSDGAYHLLDLAPGSYKITVALSGFTTLVREEIVVEVGKEVDVPFTLPISVSEVVNVTAASPIVGANVSGTSVNFTLDELEKIPTSRDPFALVRGVAGALTERVNVGGNETGQQLITVAKAARPQDTSWTLDGVEITDMAAPGQSATYFNFDNFDEIHVSTSGNDIRDRTGALNIDLIVKRGGNQFHGSGRGYFSNDDLQAANVPAELIPLGVTPDTADHLTHSADYGFDFGGPIVKDRAWFYGSYSYQNIQLFRRSTNAVDKTTLENPNVKVNVQATKKDLVNFLWYNGYKIKDNRATGLGGVATEQSGATFHQDNQYSSTPLHGLWKIGDDRVFGPRLFVSAKYAYFNTGVALTPEGGMDQQAGRSIPLSVNYGSTQRSLSTRPQHTATVDANSFFEGLGGSHQLKYGVGYRTVDAGTEALWPGNGILAIAQSTTDLRAQVFREGNGSNRADYLDFYAGDTITKGRATIDLGVRYDRQWGFADASTSQPNQAFPTLLPGIVFPGYRTPFTWNNLSPRAGVLFALDESAKTVARVSYTKFAGQLPTTTIGVLNQAAGAGSITYRWTDVNGDGFAQANEVNTNAFITSAGVNLANPTAVVSPSQFDPNLSAPTTQSLVAGIEREVAPNLSVQAAYTYSRTSNLYGNASANITPRIGLTLADYAPGTVYTGKLPDGSTYSVPTYGAIANPVALANAGGFYYTNVPGFYSDYNGVELAFVKRLSNKWMGRMSLAYNNAREHFSQAAGIYDNDGNPTRTVTEALVDGGQFAPAENGGSGTYYLNAKWQLNLNGVYMAPHGLELAGNIWGRQGFPFPLVRAVTVGTAPLADNLTLLVSPQLDSFRYPNVWDTDVRVARPFKFQTLTLRLALDVFNLFNANTALVRNNNVTSATFNALTQNMTPRVARIGVVLTF